MEQQVDTLSVLFTDLVGSTELRVQLGEEAADELRRVHDDLLSAAIVQASGIVVKGLGDGVMATFGSAADAVAGAVAAQQAVDLHNRHRPDLAFAVRIGVSVGDVSTEQGDVFGVPVVEASRLCAIGNSGEILVAELVRFMSRGRGGHVYEQMGDLELKGIPEPVPTCRVVWAPLEDQSARGSAPMPPALLSIGPTGYVGRPELLAALRASWAAAKAGVTRTTLLAGEPGVGKTRTASEIARYAHAEGAMVLLGRCEEDLAVPYQPFAEALEWYVGNVDAPRLGRLPGELVRLVPHLDQLVPGLPAAVASDAATEEHRLFEAVSSWLIDAARGDGLLFVLDDAHWAAKPTLLLLLHVLRAAAEQGGVRLDVVVTYRDTDIDRTHPLSAVLADLRRLPGVERLAVSGLSHQEVVAFLEAAAGHAMDENGLLLAQAVSEETEGNPFFVAEVIRHLVESGGIKRIEDRWVVGDAANLSVPEGVRDVVGRRLSRLSDQANQLLTVAAVVGRSAELDVLAAVAGLNEDEVLDALDEAVRARLVEEAGADRFRFAHALVRTTLYDELSATRRRRLHQKVADVLEKLHPDDVVALAYHCIEGGPSGGDVTRAVRYALASADQARAARANADAEVRYHQVLELLEDADPDQATTHQQLRVLCSIAECRKDQASDDYRELFLDVSRRAAEAGDTEVLVRAVLANNRGFASVIGVIDEERVAMIETALEAVGPEPSPARAKLLAVLANELVYHPSGPFRRYEPARQALDMARAIGDTTLLVDVCITGFPGIVSGARWREALDLIEEIRPLAEARPDPTVRSFTLLWLACSLVSAGRIAEADEALAQMIAIAESEGTPRLRWYAAAYGVRPITAKGLVDEASAANRRAFELGTANNEPDAFAWWIAAESNVMWFRGNFGDLADSFATFIEGSPHARPWMASHVLALAHGGRFEEAKAQARAYHLLDDLALGDDSAAMHDLLPFFMPAALAEAAFLAGDVEMAELIGPMLEPYPECWAHYTLAAFGPLSEYIGLCEVTCGRVDQGVALLERAVEEIRAVGYDPARALAQLDRSRAQMA